MDKIERKPGGRVSKISGKFDEPKGDAKPSRLSGFVFFLLCAIPVFSTLAFGAVDNWALGIVSLFLSFLVIFWTADCFFKKKLTINLDLIQVPVLGLILIGLIQLLPLRHPDIPVQLLSTPPVGSLSLASYQTFLAVVQLIIYFTFFAAAFVYINTHKRLKKIVHMIIIFGSLMAFFGIMQRLADPNSIYGFREIDQAIPFASFVNQHHFAAFMEMTVGLTLALLFGRSVKKDKKILLIISAVLMGISVVLTSSRGGMISLTAVIGFIIASNLFYKQKNIEEMEGAGKNHRRTFNLVAAGLGLILVFFIAVVMLGGDAALLRGIGFQSGQQDISSGRTHFWQIALKIFFDYPILGTGLDSFGLAFTQYDSWNGNYRIEQAHNDYLQILADAGICGFICVASFIFLLFKQGFQTIAKTLNSFRQDAAMGALAGCFGILLHSFFDFPLRTTSNAFFFLILTVLATAQINHLKVRYRKSS